MKSRNLFVGIIILFVGVVALLDSLNVIDFSWRVVWRLWPMLLIIGGIVVLPVKEWLRALLLVAALAVGAVLYQNEAERQSEHYDWASRSRFAPAWEWWDDIFDD